MADQRGDEADALIPLRREGPLVADGLQQPPPPEVLNGPGGVAHRPGADQRRLARPVDNGDLDAVGGEFHRGAQATRPGADDENLDLGRRRGDREAHGVNITSAGGRELRSHRLGLTRRRGRRGGHPSRPPPGRLALLRVAVDRERQPEVAAQRVGLVLAPVQPALLEDRHHRVDEVLQLVADPEGQVEAVKGAVLEPALYLVGHGGWRADERPGPVLRSRLDGLAQCPAVLPGAVDQVRCRDGRLAR